jgi:hypothetical protein
LLQWTIASDNSGAAMQQAEEVVSSIQAGEVLHADEVVTLSDDELGTVCGGVESGPHGYW